MKKFMIPLLLVLSFGQAWARKDDNPMIAMLFVDQLEYTAGDGESGVAWDADVWVGRDINKLRFMTEGAYRDTGTEGFYRLLYSRSIAPFWDLAGGWRREFGDGEQWDAGTIEILGTMPYNILTEASLSVGEGGQTVAWGRFEYVVNFGTRSPRWMLLPEFEFNAYGKDDAVRGIGSGLSNIDLGLRLHRQFRPDLSPYIGVNWHKQFGDTADFTEAAGRDSSELRWLLGLQFWF
jgi:copper resistance protein B